MSKIYLISPPKINNLADFIAKLDDIFSLNLIPVFQLRLKNIDPLRIKEISQEVQKVCHKHNVLFIINDYVDLAIEIKAGGVHVGVDDENIADIKQKTGPNFVVGASCYDSRDLAITAATQGADYVSFGAFFESKTKKSRGNPTTDIIEWANNALNVPNVAIGGITDKNCSTLINAQVDFIAVISYIWSSDDMMGDLRKLHDSIN